MDETTDPNAADFILCEAPADATGPTVVPMSNGKMQMKHRPIAPNATTEELLQLLDHANEQYAAASAVYVDQYKVRAEMEKVPEGRTRLIHRAIVFSMWQWVQDLVLRLKEVKSKQVDDKKQ